MLYNFFRIETETLQNLQFSALGCIIASKLKLQKSFKRKLYNVFTVQRYRNFTCGTGFSFERKLQRPKSISFDLQMFHLTI